MSDQKSRILTCACDLYLKHGLDGFSMRKLARKVGVTAPALYRHYESREHVVADVVREAYREFAGALYSALQGRTPQERFHRAAEVYLDFALGHPRWYQLLFITPEQMGMERLPDDLEAQGCAIHQFWVDRVRERMDEGVLRQDDPVEVSMTMWAHAHGMLTLYHHGHFEMDEADFRELFMTSAARIVRGLGTEAFARELAALEAGEPVGATG